MQTQLTQMFKAQGQQQALLTVLKDEQNFVVCHYCQNRLRIIDPCNDNQTDERLAEEIAEWIDVENQETRLSKVGLKMAQDGESRVVKVNHIQMMECGGCNRFTCCKLECGGICGKSYCKFCINGNEEYDVRCSGC
jgi:hypothetical protein